MKDIANILATTITLAGKVQLTFDARWRTDPAGTIRGHFFLLLNEDDQLLLGEVVYTVAFLTQAHDYFLNAYLGQDAEKLLNRFIEMDYQKRFIPVPYPPRHRQSCCFDPAGQYPYGHVSPAIPHRVRSEAGGQHLPFDVSARRAEPSERPHFTQPGAESRPKDCLVNIIGAYP